MRVIVCGSRYWTDAECIAANLRSLVKEYGNDHTIVHGGARGADQIAATIALGMGLQVEEHKADWRGQGRMAGPLRNRLMLDLGADMVIAFKDDADPTLRTGGTENMVRIAREAGVTAFFALRPV